MRQLNLRAMAKINLGLDVTGKREDGYHDLRMVMQTVRLFDSTFTNGAIVKDGKVYIYYASSDTRVHVAETTVEKLIDYTFNTPSDPLRSVDCVKQRTELIRKNLEILSKAR